MRIHEISNLYFLPLQSEKLSVAPDVDGNKSRQSRQLFENGLGPERKHSHASERTLGRHIGGSVHTGSR